MREKCIDDPYQTGEPLETGTAYAVLVNLCYASVELYMVPWDHPELRRGRAVSRIAHASERSA
jgi:hypothetical protein